MRTGCRPNRSGNLLFASNTRSRSAQPPTVFPQPKTARCACARSDLPVSGRFELPFQGRCVVTCIDGDMRSDTLCEQRSTKRRGDNPYRHQHSRRRRLRRCRATSDKPPPVSYTDRRVRHTSLINHDGYPQSVSGKAQLASCQRLAQQLRFRVRGPHMVSLRRRSPLKSRSPPISGPTTAVLCRNDFIDAQASISVHRH